MSATIPPLPFREAWEFWRDKVTVTAADFRALSDQYRVRAFTITGLAKMEQLRAMQGSLESAITLGQDFRQWQRRVGRDRVSALGQGWTRQSPHRLQTIFRNNIQTAYNAGRWQQQQRTTDTRPYLLYDAIDDNRTRPRHRAQDGKVYRHDDKYWNRWYPPNGHRCRCRAIALSAEDVKSEGLSILRSTAPERPDRGWASNPGRAPFRVPLNRYKANLRTAFLRDALTQPAHLMMRFLHPSDRRAFRTLQWASGRQADQDIGEWGERLRRARDVRGEIFPVGDIPGRIVNRLSARNQPRLTTVVLRGRTFRNLATSLRQARATALRAGEIERLPDLLSSRRTVWYIDRRNPDKLLAIARFRQGFLQFRIERNAEFGIGRGTGVANEIRRVEYVRQGFVPERFRMLVGPVPNVRITNG